METERKHTWRDWIVYLRANDRMLSKREKGNLINGPSPSLSPDSILFEIPIPKTLRNQPIQIGPIVKPTIP